MLFPTKQQRAYIRAIARSEYFDRAFYKGAYSAIHRLYRAFPIRHFVVLGEARDFRPNPDFSPSAYLRLNPDVAKAGLPPFAHYLQSGHNEGRLTKDLPKVAELPPPERINLRASTPVKRSRFAIVAHVYYPDIWPEFAQTLAGLRIDFDLFVTVTFRGPETNRLIEQIKDQFGGAVAVPVANKGRDILPFLTLANAGLLDGYDAVCKIHTKKSPHRDDGDHWRRHLISGVLPAIGLTQRLDAFLSNDDAAIWVADGQHYAGEKWWGSNLAATKKILNRIELGVEPAKLQFPAGSIYWLKPLMIGLVKALHLNEANFEAEQAQVDGTLAHAFERSVGFLAASAGQAVIETTGLVTSTKPLPKRPAFVSAFYLPQFHPIPENDVWWGKGFTEWRGVAAAKPAFDGHLQPMVPSDLGYYDLRVTETMGEQAALARDAGIDAFCVYHYWFDGKRVLEKPVDQLLRRPEVNFPFYLCWANESWRRNWDGLSGQVLLPQSYKPGFETDLARDAARYMRDPRYLRPDGARPRFVIYRPEDMPDPEPSVAKLRKAWREFGIGEVELGAVRFHVRGDGPVPDELFDFWVEMPPHGLIGEADYLAGGPQGNRIGPSLRSDFRGLIYDYDRAIERSVDPTYIAKLPPNTICGAMPSWDNTARRGVEAHIAYGANPARFHHWLMQISKHRLAGSYRNELFLNAWNEWAEKAVLEPSETFGRTYLDALRQTLSSRAETVESRIGHTGT